MIASSTLLVVGFQIAGPGVPPPSSETPTAVSPGDPTEAVTLGSRCPTFSWSAPRQAVESFELAVFRLDARRDDAPDTEPVLRERPPGGARSWTPPLDRCLAPGESYGWAVRAVEAGVAGEWSPVRLFAVPAEPDPRELEEALALVQEYLGAEPARPAAPYPIAERDLARAGRSDRGDAMAATAAALAGATEYGIQSVKADSDATSFAVYGLSHSRDDGSAGVVGETTSPTISFPTYGIAGLHTGASAVGAAGAFFRTGLGIILQGFHGPDQVFALTTDGAIFTKSISLDESMSLGGKLTVRGITRAEADVGIGLATFDPDNRLHVVESVAGGLVGTHVAQIHNTNTGSDADVLALRVNIPTPTARNNFVSFYAGGSNNLVGQIEGNSAGGVSFLSSSADYAEYLQRLDPDEALAPGDVVGLFGDRVSRRTRGADRVLVVSGKPLVLGNDPGEERRPDYEPIALLGQVEVRVRGAVRVGDLLLASGRNDGTAIALVPEKVAAARLGSVLGRVLAADQLPAGAGDATKAERLAEESGQRRALALVGLSDSALLADLLAARDDRLQRLEHRLDRLLTELSAERGLALQETPRRRDTD